MESLDSIRHSLAHLLAAAVLKKYPKALLGIGPVIENGFYYDFLLPKPLSSDDLKEFEVAMKKMIGGKLPFSGKKVTTAEAKKLFKDQPFKLELVKDFAKDKKPLTVYKTGDVFLDLCRGGHVKNTSEIKPDSFKLSHIAGAYWKGSEKNPQLQRIYGLSFGTKKELENYERLVEEAKRRDHRKIGQDLDLFIFREEVGPGLPLFTEKGATIRRELERFIVDEEIKRGYHHVYTPDIARVKLYEISGPYPYYKDTMYPVMQVDGDKLVLRPMTCPHHFMLYSSRPRSYRELPLRIAEVAKLYRYEKSGELSGLTRVRSFCLADSHIFTSKEKAEDVIREVIELIDYAVGKLGLKKGEHYTYRLSLGDPKNKEKFYKDPRGWKEGESALRNVLKSMKAPFYEASGEAAFYGPKIDIQMKNVMGKEETAFTVQYDFCLPSRFKLKYINAKGKEEQPVVIHRSSIGAIERTMAFLIEHFAGEFPLWLAPVQTRVLAVSEKQEEYALGVLDTLKKHGIRAEIGEATESLGKRIRQAEIQKIPYILVVGEKERDTATVSIRKRHTDTMLVEPVHKFIESLIEEIKNRS